MINVFKVTIVLLRPFQTNSILFMGLLNGYKSTNSTLSELLLPIAKKYYKRIVNIYPIYAHVRKKYFLKGLINTITSANTNFMKV